MILILPRWEWILPFIFHLLFALDDLDFAPLGMDSPVHFLHSSLSSILSSHGLCRVWRSGKTLSNLANSCFLIILLPHLRISKCETETKLELDDCGRTTIYLIYESLTVKLKQSWMTVDGPLNRPTDTLI